MANLIFWLRKYAGTESEYLKLVRNAAILSAEFPDNSIEIAPNTHNHEAESMMNDTLIHARPWIERPSEVLSFLILLTKPRLSGSSLRQ
jgi:hypothetical protein